MSDNQQSSIIGLENIALTQNSANHIYHKPQTTLFLLESLDIQSGVESVDESNNGTLIS